MPTSLNLSPFKLDIDELINEFIEVRSTAFADWKNLWKQRKFSCIYDASPPTKLAFLMQSLYAHAIGYMISTTTSFSHRLAGLYCLYCLYETQPFKPPFKVYLSLGELKKMKSIVVEAKEPGVKAVPVLVQRMLEKNMFLFGAVDLNESSMCETVNQLKELQNTRVRVANEKLFADTRIEQFLNMDMGLEFNLDLLKKMSTEYAEAKKQAIGEASNVVDVKNIEHIAEDSELIGDAMQKIVDNWSIQKEVFSQQTGLNNKAIAVPEHEQEEQNKQYEQLEYDGEFSRHLELQLYEERSQEEEEQEDEDFMHEIEQRLSRKH
ncbi:hypothetical protein K2173_017891 [Erythroxylum novogranatense]|uniref:Uncharacterized protein n=1 Tax=Erythroxylum novogranatense TaxID=1862640 RepID=A0AAV8SN12_9ROSI|nr:hypothetical protein K2173_017891 [Erythroxylum novogranatense]